jgi:hypothetical protein
MSAPRQRLRGPMEDLDWPRTLPARVVTPGPRPRLHGYDVHGDLAQHYGFAELVLTALRGEAPTSAEGELLEVTLMFLAPCSVAEPPSHVAVLSRACGARTSSMIAASAVTLAEQAAAIIEQHLALIEWLCEPQVELPEQFRCLDPHEREAVVALRSRVGRTNLDVIALEHDPTLMAALLATAHRSGLRRPDQLQALLVTARLPVVLAEGLAFPKGGRREYPADVPHFQYDPTEPERA